MVSSENPVKGEKALHTNISNHNIFTRTLHSLTKHYNTVLIMAISFLAFIAFIWLSYELWRLIVEPDFLFNRPVKMGGIDLKHRMQEVTGWFKSVPIYENDKDAIYPPASYMIFLPLFGWGTLNITKVVWILSALVSIVFLIPVLIRESGAKGYEKIFIAMIPLAIYPTGATIGNGQISIHIIFFLFTGICLLFKRDKSLLCEITGCVFFLIALSKPSISVPFFWIILFAHKSLRPSFLIITGYVFLTFSAASFQNAGIIELCMQWLMAGSAIAEGNGESNIHYFLSFSDLSKYNLHASLLLLALNGAWVIMNRRSGIILLIGGTAIFARFWTYHAWYDDLLILLPLIALFKIAKESDKNIRVRIFSIGLFTINLILLIAPGGLYLLPSPLNILCTLVQTVMWIAILLFLFFSGYSKFNNIAISGKPAALNLAETSVK